LVNDACKYDDGQLRYINFRSLLSILYLAFGFFNNTETKNFENNNGEAVLTSNVSASKSSLLETVDI
jgi:hypothetical protein